MPAPNKSNTQASWSDYVTPALTVLFSMIVLWLFVKECVAGSPDDYDTVLTVSLASIGMYSWPMRTRHKHMVGYFGPIMSLLAALFLVVAPKALSMIALLLLLGAASAVAGQFIAMVQSRGKSAN